MAVTPLWMPAPGRNTPMDRYREHINRKFNQNLRDSHELQKWSIKRRHDFWIDLWSYVGLIPDLPRGTTKVYDDHKSVKDNPPFFEGVRINYAENVLSNRDLNAIALIGIREGQSLDGDKWTWAELTENVRRVRSALLRRGVRREDRVGAIMSNSNWIIGINGPACVFFTEATNRNLQPYSLHVPQWGPCSPRFLLIWVYQAA